MSFEKNNSFLLFSALNNIFQLVCIVKIRPENHQNNLRPENHQVEVKVQLKGAPTTLNTTNTILYFFLKRNAKFSLKKLHQKNFEHFFKIDKFQQHSWQIARKKPQYLRRSAVPKKTVKKTDQKILLSIEG